MTWESLRRGLGLAEPETDTPAASQVKHGKSDTELAAEFAPFSGLQDLPFSGAYQLAPDSGITVSPVPVTYGQRIEVAYDGLLAQSGAQSVVLHYGFGPGNWRNVQDIEMTKDNSGRWAAEVSLEDHGRFNFCFKDDADNWDNNYGKNWSYQIHGSRGH